jgi:hypothetical protein
MKGSGLRIHIRLSQNTLNKVQMRVYDLECQHPVQSFKT